MKRNLIVTLLLAATALTAFGDSIDDAEAKRRGVPVAQVQAENALAKERQKNADLEKQLTAIQKELADLRRQNPLPVPSSAPAIAPAASAVPLPINFDGPREASPLYDDLVKRYLAGDWSTLAADLAAKEKEIAKLPAGNRADLVYIKQTVAECRPFWWDQARAGKETQFKQTVWSRPVGISYKAAGKPGISTTTLVNGTPMTGVSWPPDDMESRDAMSMMYLGIGTNDPSNFVRADGADYLIWTVLGDAQVIQQHADTLAKLPPAERAQLEAFAEFRGSLTVAYYGTPPARRLAFIQSATAMNWDGPHVAELYAHRPLAAAFLIELRTHLDQYPSMGVSETTFLLDPERVDLDVEFVLADFVISRKLLNTRLTLAEDRRLRELVKTLADANQDSKITRVQLPGKLAMEFDPDKDKATRIERLKSIRYELKGQ